MGTRGGPAGESRTTFEFIPRNRPSTTLTLTADGLNTTIAANSARHGWTIVDESFSDSRGHGYCAPDRWVTQIIDSFVGQGDEFGTFHPNIKGQISIGTAVTSTATELLSPYSGELLAARPLWSPRGESNS